jgi:hypothetical protein
MDPEPASRLFSAAPAALGGAAVAWAQKSSAHRAASRMRSMSIIMESQEEAFASNFVGVWRMYIQDHCVRRSAAADPTARYPDGPDGEGKAQQGAIAASTILQRPLSLVRHRPRATHISHTTQSADTHMPFPTATHVSLVRRVGCSCDL